MLNFTEDLIEKKKLISSSHDREDINSTQNYIRFINSRNVKSLAVILVILFAIYHGYLNSYYGKISDIIYIFLKEIEIWKLFDNNGLLGRNSCNRLLDEGRILGNDEWQPYGCMIHKYDEKDIKTCFNYIKYYNGQNKFFFIGDSRIQQIYKSFVRQFDANYKTSNEPNQNLSYSSQLLNLEVNFVWQPIMSESLYTLIESLLQVNRQKPSFLVMGMGTEYMMMNTSDKEIALDFFKSNLTNLVDMINDVNYDNLSFETSINSPRRIRNKRAAVRTQNTPTPTRNLNLIALFSYDKKN